MSKTIETSDARPGLGQRFIRWVQEPLGSIITASVATIGSLGLVVSGIWVVNLAIN